VRACAGHEAVLGYVIGNEIPASIVRWHGGRAVERFIERLYAAAKTEDPGGLVTYVNYPTTEYLELPFLDIVCFNVYLESEERFGAYLARLQNIAGERPLLMAEVGLDSRRHGEAAQAEGLDWQIRRSFVNGCAGVFVFAWTDEWHRGGHDIEDWEFGLTRRDRRPKAALATVRRAFADVPVDKGHAWPRISVVVCSYNGARTIRDCFEGLLRLEYPDFEVIVVNDGSTDATATLTSEYGVRLITTENRGLSSARNTGMEAATGEIVAYIDDDAHPDPHWLTYLALMFLTTSHVGVGGPNIAPPNDGLVADCVAHVAGGPVHVLISDTEAEHLPGCNMAFWKTALQAVGGFDPQFRTAGDDVDLCWRLQERGWTLGFSAAAAVWHHRRRTVRAYWRQQVGYGRAEAQLARKWPAKYNAAGHVSWSGRIYGPGVVQRLFARRRIYHGAWGSAPFQRVYWPAPNLASSVLAMPEWWLVILVLLALSALSSAWPPLLGALPLLTLGLGASLLQAGLAAARVSAARRAAARGDGLRFLALTTFLHLLQPVARLVGRLRGGLTPWRGRRVRVVALPRPRTWTLWVEAWRSPGSWLESLADALRATGSSVLLGGPFDGWDLQVLDGTLGSVRLRLGIEEHGAGRQYLRFHAWPRCSGAAVALALLFMVLGCGAALAGAWVASALLLGVALQVALWVLRECAGATGAVSWAVNELAARGAVTGCGSPRHGRRRRAP
jgi:GT2 family glycosyltransferase